ncbi:NADP-dependent oxidoreductase (plasmid) [Streptomyces sp. BI20]|uniref:NADP-dependent oxidoreductase n=1 Tax=Streptomyces sp. BI20 TaxID=3403460 RepID=UPI003C7149EC
MKAIAFHAPGGPEVLLPVELPTPEVGPGEVRVRMRAAGVQPVDLAIREGFVPPGVRIGSPHVVGGDFAGVVDAVGAGVTAFAVGDEVLGYRAQGTYAEFVVVPVGQVVARPAGVPWEQAGALSASGQTAHTALEVLEVGLGDTFLVNGAAGGVGSVAVQLAVERGAVVIAAARPEHHGWLRELGARPVAYGAGLVERARALAPGGIVHAALDTASVAGLEAACELVADRGRVGTVFAAERAVELGARWIRSDRRPERLAALAERLGDGRLRVHVRETFPLERAADAHRAMAVGHGRGKIVLLGPATA